MHWTAFLAYRRFPAHARVMEDCACIQCGYNLRMQMVSARCPECGNEVGNSVFLLAKPSVTARDVRTAGVTYLAPLTVVLMFLSSAYWAMFVVALTATVAAVFRVLALSDLRFNAALARLPVVGSRLTIWWVCACLDLLIAGAWMIGMIVISGSPSMQGTTAAANIIAGGSTIWFVSMFLSAWAAGRFGFALMDMLNFTWTRIEFRVQQFAVVIVMVLLPFLVLGIAAITSSTSDAILTALLLVLTLLVMLMTAIALLHAASACDASTSDWDELIESERIAVVPESQRPRKSEPPAIKVEAD